MTKNLLELCTLNLVEVSKTFNNPFTGEKIENYIDNGFSSDELDYIKNYFKERNWLKVNNDGFREIWLNNENEVWFRDFNFQLSEGFSAIAVEYDRIDKNFADFLFSLITNTNSVVRVSEENAATVSVNPPELAQKRWRNLHRVSNEIELFNWLTKFGG